MLARPRRDNYDVPIPERIGLLNRSDGAFFLVVQDALATDTHLMFGGLADPGKTFRKEPARF